MLRKIRTTLALIAFASITLLFLDFTGTLRFWFGWLAKIQFLPAVLALNLAVVVVLVVLTLLLGRIYCSIVCPLGVMQDVVSWLHGKRKKNRFSFSPERRWLRYSVLAVFIVAIAAGVGSFVALLAPYSSYGRIVANLFQPLYLWGNNVLADIAEHYESYAFYHTDVWMKSLPTFIIAAVSFVVVCILAWRGGRTYCNTICPVGTVLSFLARFSLLRIRFDEEKCRNCSLCSKNCKAACIDFKTHSVDYSRCVVCGDCIDKCKFGALTYGIKRQRTTDNGQQRTVRASRFSREENASTPDLSRRTFLVAAAASASAAAWAQAKKKVDGGLAVIEDKEVAKRETPLTPPGSISAKNMAQHCTACQLCVAQCPNQVLRPSSGLLTLMQPTMSFERGYCRPECTRCSQVCPAGAIRPIERDEKSSIQIGHAVPVHKNCIETTDGVSCGNCERHCPVGAIQMVPQDPEDPQGAYWPVVNESRCIGCGACEHLCPARPTAIYVEGHEVHKIN